MFRVEGGGVSEARLDAALLVLANHKQVYGLGCRASGYDFRISDVGCRV